MSNGVKIKQRKLGIYIASALVLTTLVFVGYATLLVDIHPSGDLRVIFLDVSQGDAILIQTPSGKNILIDGGPDKSIIYKLDSYIPITKRTIDIMIATHADADHITGLIEVLNRYTVNMIFDNGLSGSAPAYDQWEQLVDAHNISRVAVDAPKTIVLSDNVVLQFLWPEQSMVMGQESDRNFASVVNSIIYKDVKFLFTGDATIETEEILLAHNIEVSADVLKLGHHGSKYSSGIEFVKASSPVYGIISVGKDNTFGHPTLRALKNLQLVGAYILRTDVDGDILFVSNGKTLEVQTQNNP